MGMNQYKCFYNSITHTYIAPDNYLEHRFGNFSVGTRALLRTFSANRGTYVLSDLEHMRILYLEHAIIYTCKYMYMYTYIQLNIAYLYYIYRWCDVALRYMEMTILRYIEIIWPIERLEWSKAYSGTRFEINRYIYWAEQNERMDPDALGERLQFEHQSAGQLQY